MGNCFGLPNKSKIYTDKLHYHIKADITSEYSDNNEPCIYTS